MAQRRRNRNLFPVQSVRIQQIVQDGRIRQQASDLSWAGDTAPQLEYDNQIPSDPS